MKKPLKRPIFTRAKVVFVLIFSIFLLIFLTGCMRNSSGVILAGSTSVQPFAEVLSEEYMVLHHGVTIDVQGGGSAAGILAAQSGTADIGMSSRSLAGDETKLWSVEIARDGLAIVINAHNPVVNLTIFIPEKLTTGARWEDRKIRYMFLPGKTAQVRVRPLKLW
jgi:phosphate transport system substrate-binding protein